MLSGGNTVVFLRERQVECDQSGWEIRAMNEWDQKKKLLFIYNPRAGKEKIRSNLLDIIDIFAKADYEIMVYPTQSQGDGRKAVVERKKKFFDLIWSTLT